MITNKKVYRLYFDGCSKGNPGRAGCGAVLYDDDDVEVSCASRFVGDRETCNTAEYNGLLLGFELASTEGVEIMCVYGDSALVINQMLGKFKCTKPHLQNLQSRALEEIQRFKHIDFEHVLRNKNKRADELANLGLV
jgi:ribonuclease HI